MKQLLILSGKGGTGKTTLASTFIKLSSAGACADCDVDAPNLHLIMKQTAKPATHDYFGLPKAKISPDQCAACDLCWQFCRFEAIIKHKGYQVDPYACEGCGVCEAMCPVNAISMQPVAAGELVLYNNTDFVFSTASLKIGSGTTGLLVTEVKKQLKSASIHTKLAIIDGSPGIGCPVIASLSGVDMVLIVAEPSVSGISDMERIIKTAAQFGIKMAVCVNKYDTNLEITKQIEAFCEKQGLAFTGTIPFDSEAVKAINHGQTLADINCRSGTAVKAVYSQTMKLLFANGDD